MFWSFSILFCCIVLFSYGSQKRSEDSKREWEVTSQEEIPNQEEGLHKMIGTTQSRPSATQKDLNNWPEQNMLPGTFMFWSLLLVVHLLVSFAASPVAALHFALTSHHTSCRPFLMPSHSL